MAPKPAGREAGLGSGRGRYERHRLEHIFYTLLQLESDFGILQLEKPRLVFFDDMFAFPESRQP